jgi:hypothetical protein
MTSFRDTQTALLDASGWVRCPSVARAVSDAGLPVPDAGYLAGAFSEQQWADAERAVGALREHFDGARFAAEVRYGLLLVPDPARLDTRKPMPAEVRGDQLGRPAEDVVDERLPAGRAGIAAGPDTPEWTTVATVTGRYGLSLGSYRDIAGGPAASFTVDGQDTRRLMTRQLWGARVLQSGRELPDWEGNDHWTFTLFAGEPLTEGAAESGTVLNGHVRFRLGKPDRGIGPVRVAPAIAIR